eukprot:SAG31_NODE_630_length_13427_cov_27.066327_2_plen_61_part_00
MVCPRRHDMLLAFKFVLTPGHCCRLDKLSHMLAAEELAPEDVRQMLYELETAYSEFHKAL